MRYLVFFVIVTALVSIASIYVVGEPGYVYIHWADWQVETSLAIFAAAAVALLLVVYLVTEIIGIVFRIPSRLGRSYRKYRGQKTLRTASQAFQHLVLGEWTKAEKQFDSSAKGLPEPVMNYLAAAYASQQNGDLPKSKRYLQRAKELGSEYEHVVALFSCKLRIQRKEYAEAITDLRVLCSKLPNNPVAFKALAELYRETGQWSLLHQLLPHLTKSKAYSTSELKELTNELLRHRLQDVTSAGELMKVWNQAANIDRQNPEFASVYVRKLLEYGRHQEAEKIVRKTLDKRWDTHLAYLYGLVGGEIDAKKMYDTATKWTQNHGDDVNLLLTVGKLANRLQIWGKAQSSIESAIDHGAGREAFELLGSTLEAQGKSDEASDIYKKGLSIYTGA